MKFYEKSFSAVEDYESIQSEAEITRSHQRGRLSVWRTELSWCVSIWALKMLHQENLKNDVCAASWVLEERIRAMNMKVKNDETIIWIMARMGEARIVKDGTVVNLAKNATSPQNFYHRLIWRDETFNLYNDWKQVMISPKIQSPDVSFKF